MQKLMLYLNDEEEKTMSKIKPMLWNESIMVADESELAELNVEPGTVAYTAGFGNMWQLDAEGTWQTIVEEG